jgi:hypothetical protein
MSSATVRSGGRLRPAGDDAERASLRPWLIGLVAVALLALLVAWLGGWLRLTTDPRVAEILALQEQARARFSAAEGSGNGSLNLADATAAATAMMEIRQKTEALPEHLRQQVERNGSSMFRSAFRARIDRYFALPPEQRQAELDRQIAEEETWRKAFEAGQAAMNAVAAAGRLGQPAGQGSGQTGGQANTGNPPWANRTEDERNRWRKGMVDRTTPEERARYTEWRRARDARREQLGLPSRWPR